MNLAAWLTRHAQNAIGSLGALQRNPVGSALTIGVIAIALALPAALNLVVQTGRTIAGSWEDIRDFSVYLAPTVPEAEARALARALEAEAAVASVRVISADAALDELGRDPVFGDVMAALETNPLPHTLVVRPQEDASPGAISAVAESLAGRPGVDLVKLDTEWLARLNAILDFLRRGVLIAGGLLAVAVVIIVGNTIRLDIQHRAAEIEVIKLLGASDGFVRRPFLYLGFWYGLLGGGLALVLLGFMLLALGGPVTRLAGLYGSTLGLKGPDLVTMAAVLGGGTLAGWGGAWVAVGRHLSAIQPRV